VEQINLLLFAVTEVFDNITNVYLNHSTTPV